MPSKTSTDTLAPSSKKPLAINGNGNMVEQPSNAHITGFIHLLSQCVNEEGFLALSKIQQENEELKKTVDALNAANEGNMITFKKTKDTVDAQSEELLRMEQDRKVLKEALDGQKAQRAKDTASIKELSDKIAGMIVEIKKKEHENINLRSEKDAETDKAKEAASLAKRLKEQESRNQEIQMELNAIREFTVDMQSVEDIGHEAASSLKALFKSAHELMRLFLFQDLSQESLSEAGFWTSIRAHKDFSETKIPLPASNSEVAKQMRMALGLAVLSRALRQHMFHLCYLIAADNDLCEALWELREEDATKDQENHARSVMLNIFPESQKEIGKVRLEDTILSALPLRRLVPKDKQKDFEAGLHRVCSEALRIWTPLQRVKQAITAHMTVDADDDCWQRLEFPTAGNEAGARKGGPQKQGDKGKGQATDVKAPASTVDKDALAVWPAFMADDDDSTLLHRGYVLLKEQVRAAEEEKSQEEMQRRNARERRRTGEFSAEGGVASRRRNSTRDQRSFLFSSNGDNSPVG